jgi:hypothetical protein
MKKHGISHGGALPVCTIASALLVDLIRNNVPILDKIVTTISTSVINMLHIQHDPEYISILIYATILATIWGAAFSFMHSDKRD